MVCPAGCLRVKEAGSRYSTSTGSGSSLNHHLETCKMPAAQDTLHTTGTINHCMELEPSRHLTGTRYSVSSLGNISDMDLSPVGSQDRNVNVSPFPEISTPGSARSPSRRGGGYETSMPGSTRFLDLSSPLADRLREASSPVHSAISRVQGVSSPVNTRYRDVSSPVSTRIPGMSTPVSNRFPEMSTPSSTRFQESSTPVSNRYPEMSSPVPARYPEISSPSVPQRPVASPNAYLDNRHIGNNFYREELPSYPPAPSHCGICVQDGLLQSRNPQDYHQHRQHHQPFVNQQHPANRKEAVIGSDV